MLGSVKLQWGTPLISHILKSLDEEPYESLLKCFKYLIMDLLPYCESPLYQCVRSIENLLSESYEWTQHTNSTLVNSNKSN